MSTKKKLRATAKARKEEQQGKNALMMVALALILFGCAGLILFCLL